MRGDKESACLDRIKTALFYKEGKPICNPVSGQTAFNETDDTFLLCCSLYYNSDFLINCFGLSGKDIPEFVNIIRTAKPNPSNSDFPDFIFDSGYIEHFQITSSKENKKGAMQIKKEREFFRKVESESNKAIEEWNSAEPSYEKIRSKTFKHDDPDHNYPFLVQSFKQNWEHHIDSSRKYNGAKNIGVFMIEYQEQNLAMKEKTPNSLRKDIFLGDLYIEKFKEYRLSRDKDFLKYINDYRNEIKYVIFLNSKRYEIIKTENIPFLIQLMPRAFNVYPLTTGIIDIFSNISVPFQTKERGDEDE